MHEIVDVLCNEYNIRNWREEKHDKRIYEDILGDKFILDLVKEQLEGSVAYDLIEKLGFGGLEVSDKFNAPSLYVSLHRSRSNDIFLVTTLGGIRFSGYRGKFGVEFTVPAADVQVKYGHHNSSVPSLVFASTEGGVERELAITPL